MNLAPLLQSSGLIQAHTYAAAVAVLIGAAQLAMPKGTTRHRILGYIWVSAFLIVSLSSFGIKEIMPNSVVFGFSPIHILSVVSLITIAGALLAVRHGLVAAHARALASLYVMGLLVAGAFTLLPGRVLHKVFFG